MFGFYAFCNDSLVAVEQIYGGGGLYVVNHQHVVHHARIDFHRIYLHFGVSGLNILQNASFLSAFFAGFVKENQCYVIGFDMIQIADWRNLLANLDLI